MASARPVWYIAARWNIALDESHVIRHHQIRASKTCPGNSASIADILKRVPIASAAASVPVQNPVSEKGVGATNTTTVPAPLTPTGGVIVVRTTKRVNLRLGKPSTAVPVVRVLFSYMDVVVSKAEIGRAGVQGTAHWYADIEGNYFGRGRRTLPIP